MGERKRLGNPNADGRWVARIVGSETVNTLMEFRITPGGWGGGGGGGGGGVFFFFRDCLFAGAGGRKAGAPWGRALYDN